MGVGWALLGLLPLSPAPAAEEEEEEPLEIPAQYTQLRSWVESGIIATSGESYRFGDFTGLENQQVYYLGNFDLSQRNTWNDESSLYWRLRGSNIGLESRRFRIDQGMQGKYSLNLFFDQIPKFWTDDGGIVYGNLGDSALFLQTPWTSGPTALTLVDLTGDLRDPHVKQERRRAGGGLRLNPLPGWDLDFRYNRDAKTGDKLSSGTVGVNGGNPRAMIIPEALDFDTQRLDLTLRNSGERAQFEFGYNRSTFENDKEAQRWQVPFSNVGGWDTAAFYPAFASKGTAPDNDFGQFTFAGGYNLFAGTRIMLNAAYGQMEQDETYQPYTINPGLAVTTPLPRNDLHGQIDTTFLSVGIVSQLLEAVEGHVRYRFDDRDNDSSQATYIYVPSDAADQGTIASATARNNHPYGYQSNLVEAGTSIDVARRTSLGLDYAFELVDRTFTEVEKTREHRAEATLDSRLSEMVGFRLKAGVGSRHGTSYEDDLPFLEGHTPQYLATIVAPNVAWENHPELRRYYLADRERLQAGGQLTLTPNEMLSVGLGVNFIDDNYDQTEVGLTDSQRTAYTLDLDVNPLENVHGYAFYSYEQPRYEQNGWSIRGGANQAIDAVDATRRWNQTIQDDIHTVGGGVTTALFEGRLELNMDYLFTRATTGIDSSNSLAPAIGLPDEISRLHNFYVGAGYHLNENLTFRAGYLFEKFDWSNWGYDDVTVTTMNNVVSFGSLTPDDRTSMGIFSIVYSLD